MTQDRPLSRLEEIEANPITARELAAARVESDAIAVMHKVLELSGESVDSMAAILDMPSEILSEILEGSRPFPLAFVGRLVRACGFQAHVTFGDMS